MNTGNVPLFDMSYLRCQNHVHMTSALNKLIKFISKHIHSVHPSLIYHKLQFVIFHSFAAYSSAMVSVPTVSRSANHDHLKLIDSFLVDNPLISRIQHTTLLIILLTSKLADEHGQSLATSYQDVTSQH